MGTRCKPVSKELVKPLNLFNKNGNRIKIDIFSKSKAVKFYEQMGNFAVANFYDGSYSTDYELVN